MTRILVVDDEANVQRLLQYTLKQAGYTVTVAGDGVEAIRMWASESPDLILLDVTLAKLDGYGVAEKIRADEGGRTHVPIIMLTAEKEVEQKVRGLRAGADDYLVKPFHQAELLARMRSLLARFGPTDGTVGKPPLGKMIAFYGAKGGVGATTVAINTAIALHANHDRKVVLVDAVLQFGDHRVFLDLGPDRKSIADAVAAPTVDSDLLKSVLVKHDSGIDLLLAPSTPEDGDLIREDRLVEVLTLLESLYDYVVVDMDKRIGDLTLSVLDRAHEIHIVMTADLSCLKNVRLALGALDRIGYDRAKIRLVLNRSNAFTGISVSAAENALKREFEHKISNEYRTAITAQNSGKPFSFARTETTLAKEIGGLAARIDASNAPVGSSSKVVATRR
ncbi:MAG TPA: response regulator [Candidatus Acidoferrales bacterium]|nr:response regulator [Candidatus Acidoferrales bacterium]